MNFKVRIFLAGFILITQFSTAQEIPQKGLASYYGKKFHGKLTANGERFNMNAHTSAHRTLPFNSLVKVTNLSNGKSTIVRVNDRGPALKSRIIDLSKAAADKIGMVNSGIARVKVELVDSMDSSDDSLLSADCCYSEVEAIDPIHGYGLNGKSISARGDAMVNNSKSKFHKTIDK